MKKTKIVCTIGPASEHPDVMRQMVLNGMNVARLNFSHGSLEEHLKRLETVRKLSEEIGVQLGVILDIQGPKIRTGPIRGGGRVTLERGAQIVLTTRQVEGDASMVSVGYPDLPAQVRPGNTIFLDDGEIELRVEWIKGDEVGCRVVVGGPLSSHKGVSLPGVKLNLPAVTQVDREHIAFGVRHAVDYVAASFVRNRSNIEAVRRAIRDAGGDIPIIAKVESHEGFDNIDKIIEAADAVMVARGDLGVEMPPEQVPLTQKTIISKCNKAGKPVITATQMLESMRSHRRPTRAEATDVANAILDGTDAVMLSGETAVGKYPAEAVEMMRRICEYTEGAIQHRQILESRQVSSRASIADAISYATCQAVEDLELAAIICSTQSGATARLVSKYRPRCPILAATPSVEVARRLSLVWGVYPALVPKSANIDDMIDKAVGAALERGIAKPGDVLAITAGVRTGVPGSTNLLQIQVVEEQGSRPPGGRES